MFLALWRLCELVEIERSSYYAWLKATPARQERARADAQLAERIRVVHREDNTCGAPRITAELNDGVPADQKVNHKRVARVMREHAIAGYRRRRTVRTTIPEPADAKVPDLLKRDFTATAPNRRYVGDITYLPIADGSPLLVQKSTVTAVPAHSSEARTRPYVNLLDHGDSSWLMVSVLRARPAEQASGVRPVPRPSGPEAVDRDVR